MHGGAVGRSNGEGLWGAAGGGAVGRVLQRPWGAARGCRGRGLGERLGVGAAGKAGWLNNDADAERAEAVSWK